MLIPPTQIATHEDVHAGIDHAQEKAGRVLKRDLNYSMADAAMFSMILSELMQNVIEHAEAPGEISAQVRNGQLTITVDDEGIGFRGSLAREHAVRFGDEWSDRAALEGAFIHGLTRFRDPGRGQGLKQVQSRVRRWGGTLLVTSGDARIIMEGEEWNVGDAIQASPGAHITITLPKRAR